MPEDDLGAPNLQGVDSGVSGGGGLPVPAGGGGLPAQAGGTAPNGVPWAITAQGSYDTQVGPNKEIYQVDAQGQWWLMPGGPQPGGAQKPLTVGRGSMVYDPVSGRFLYPGGSVSAGGAGGAGGAAGTVSGAPGYPQFPNYNPQNTLSPGQMSVNSLTGKTTSNPLYDPSQYALLVQEANRQYQLSIMQAQQKWQQDRDTQAYRNATIDSNNQLQTQLLGIQRAQLSAQVELKQREMNAPVVINAHDGRTLVMNPNEFLGYNPAGGDGSQNIDWGKWLGDPNQKISTPSITGTSAQPVPEIPGINNAPLELPKPRADAEPVTAGPNAGGAGAAPPISGQSRDNTGPDYPGRGRTTDPMTPTDIGTVTYPGSVTPPRLPDVTLPGGTDRGGPGYPGRGVTSDSMTPTDVGTVTYPGSVIPGDSSAADPLDPAGGSQDPLEVPGLPGLGGIGNALGSAGEAIGGALGGAGNAIGGALGALGGLQGEPSHVGGMAPPDQDYDQIYDPATGTWREATPEEVRAGSGIRYGLHRNGDAYTAPPAGEPRLGLPDWLTGLGQPGVGVGQQSAQRAAIRANAAQRGDPSLGDAIGGALGGLGGQPSGGGPYTAPAAGPPRLDINSILASLGLNFGQGGGEGDPDLEELGAGAGLGQPMEQPPGGIVPPVPAEDIVGQGHLFGQPVENETPFHKGVDLQAMRGVPAISPVNGTVVSVGDRGDLGLSVTIEDEAGQVHELNHLDKIAATEGTEVMAGDLVGTVGSSGNSSGPHLDYRVRGQSGDFVDPNTNPVIGGALAGKEDMSDVDLSQLLGGAGGGDYFGSGDGDDWSDDEGGEMPSDDTGGDTGWGPGDQYNEQDPDTGGWRQVTIDQDGNYSTNPIDPSQYGAYGIPGGAPAGGEQPAPGQPGFTNPAPGAQGPPGAPGAPGEPGPAFQLPWGGQQPGGNPAGTRGITDLGFDPTELNTRISGLERLNGQGYDANKEMLKMQLDANAEQQTKAIDAEKAMQITALDAQFKQLSAQLTNNVDLMNLQIAYAKERDRIEQETEFKKFEVQERMAAAAEASQERIAGTEARSNVLSTWGRAAASSPWLARMSGRTPTAGDLGSGTGYGTQSVNSQNLLEGGATGAGSYSDYINTGSGQAPATWGGSMQGWEGAGSGGGDWNSLVGTGDGEDDSSSGGESSGDSSGNSGGNSSSGGGGYQYAAGANNSGSPENNNGGPGGGSNGGGGGLGDTNNQSVRADLRKQGYYIDDTGVYAPGAGERVQSTWSGSNNSRNRPDNGNRLPILGGNPISPSNGFTGPQTGFIMYQGDPLYQRFFGPGTAGYSAAPKPWAPGQQAQWDGRDPGNFLGQRPGPVASGPSYFAGKTGADALNLKKPIVRGLEPIVRGLDLNPSKPKPKKGSGGGDWSDVVGSGAGDPALESRAVGGPPNQWGDAAGNHADNSLFGYGLGGGEGTNPFGRGQDDDMVTETPGTETDDQTTQGPPLESDVPAETPDATGASAGSMGGYSPWGLGDWGNWGDWGGDATTTSAAAQPPAAAAPTGGAAPATGGTGGFANNIDDLTLGNEMPAAPSLKDWEQLGPFGQTSLRYALESAGYNWAPYAEAMLAGWRQTGQQDTDTGLSGSSAPHLTNLGMQSLNPLQQTNLQNTAELFGPWSDYANRESRAWQNGLRNMSTIRA